MFKNISLFSTLALTGVLGLGALVAAESGPRAKSAEKPSAPASVAVPTPAAPTPVPVATDPGYRLASGDTVLIIVTGEADLTTTQTLGRSGEIRLELITGDVSLADKSVREAEAALEALYRERKLLKKPVIRVSVVGFTQREVWVSGAVLRPGPVAFPPGEISMDIVEAILKAGGFTPISKADAVRITRRLPDGKEASPQTVDLGKVMSGRNKDGRDRADILVYPGDRISVPETIF